MEATIKKLNGETVAVKKIANAFEDAIDCKRTLREIRLLQHFNHENVLNLRDIMTPPPGPLDQWNDIYLALELQNGGGDVLRRVELDGLAVAADDVRSTSARW